MKGANRALKFSRYLLGAVGRVDRDKNARPGVIKLIKNGTSDTVSPFHLPP
jgi:hypothetical protein